MKEIWAVVDSKKFNNGRLVDYEPFSESRGKYTIAVVPTAFHLRVIIKHHNCDYKEWNCLTGHEVIEIVENFRNGNYDKPVSDDKPHLGWFAP